MDHSLNFATPMLGLIPDWKKPIFKKFRNTAEKALLENGAKTDINEIKMRNRMNGVGNNIT